MLVQAWAGRRGAPFSVFHCLLLHKNPKTQCLKQPFYFIHGFGVEEVGNGLAGGLPLIPLMSAGADRVRGFTSKMTSSLIH